MYTLTFSIVDFENLRWNDKVFDIMLGYPGVKERDSFTPGIELYTLENPREHIAAYNFYLVEGSLYKIEVVFDNETVGRDQIKEIYDTIIEKMGRPISQDKIDQNLITTRLTGNSRTFRPDQDTMVYYKGIDTLDSDGNMIDSRLILEYRNIARLNVQP